MNASALEYRFRYALHGIIYALGFWAPWERYTRLSFGGTTAWTALSGALFRSGLLGFGPATQILLVLACLSAVAGAALRLWGAAYLGAPVVHSQSMHGAHVLADGPFRHLRNPLYLGTFLDSIALALIMPPSGAIVSVALIALLQVRLALAEEPFLLARLGQSYAHYLRAVPRFLPALRPRVPSAGDRPNWTTALLSEIFVLGTAIDFLAFGYTYNTNLLLKGVLVSFGLSLVAKAFIPVSQPAAGPTLPAA